MNNVIIPAAGSSSRLGEKDKLLLDLDEKPAIIHTLKPFQDLEKIDNIILVTRKNKIEKFKDLTEKYDIDKIYDIVLGGDSRQDSVYNGLKACPDNSNLILVHDGARPLVSRDIIYDTIKAVEKYGAAVVGTPCKETIKISKDGFAVKTPDRNKLWNVQTPQGIDYDLALEAFERAYEDNFQGTDDVSLVERLGKKVKIVEGNYENIKITTPEDIEIVRKLFNKNG